MTVPPDRSHPGGHADIPPLVEQLLLGLVDDGFTLYCCQGRCDPTVLVGSYEWEHYVDIVTIRGRDDVTAARAPRRGEVDVFAPEVVMWAYQGHAEWALRALLELVHPDHPDAPTTTYPAPPSLHIPRHEQRPLTIRPPLPLRAGVQPRGSPRRPLTARSSRRFPTLSETSAVVSRRRRPQRARLARPRAA